MIEVFKTNIINIEETVAITKILLKHFPILKIDFDLEDCDKILRVEADDFDAKTIIDILESNNRKCEVLI